MSRLPPPHPVELGDYWTLPEVLDALPEPGEPITDGRPYLREEAPGEYVIQGVGYLPIIEVMWETLRLCGLREWGQEDYRSWCERYLEQANAEWFTPDMVATMAYRDLMYLLRTIQREERFCDGSWKAAHERGLFHAIIRRKIELAGGDKSRKD